MDSGCPGDEAEVDIPAIEKDRGGKELDGSGWQNGSSLKISEGFLIRLCAVLSRRGSMFVQWKSCPGLPPRPCASANIAESSSRHLQFLGQLLNLSVANTPPFLLFRGRSTAGVTSPLFRVDFVERWSCRTISCSRSTNFSSKTRLSNWRTARLRVTWLDGNGIINGGREDGAVALRLRMSAGVHRLQRRSSSVVKTSKGGTVYIHITQRPKKSSGKSLHRRLE